MKIYDYYLEKFGNLNESEKRILHHVDSENFNFEGVGELLKSSDSSPSSFYLFLRKNNIKSYREFCGLIRSFKDSNENFELSGEVGDIFKKYQWVIEKEYMSLTGGDIENIIESIVDKKEIIIYSEDDIHSIVMNRILKNVKNNVWNFTNLREMFGFMHKAKKPILILINTKGDIKFQNFAEELGKDYPVLYIGMSNAANCSCIRTFGDNETISSLHSIIFIADIIKYELSKLEKNEKTSNEIMFSFYKRLLE